MKLSDNENKITKKDKLRIAYIVVYVLVIVGVILFGLFNPEFLQQVHDLIEVISKALNIF